MYIFIRHQTSTAFHGLGLCIKPSDRLHFPVKNNSVQHNNRKEILSRGDLHAGVTIIDRTIELTDELRYSMGIIIQSRSFCLDGFAAKVRIIIHRHFVMRNRVCGKFLLHRKVHRNGLVPLLGLRSEVLMTAHHEGKIFA
jgi:hypothetical protein